MEIRALFDGVPERQSPQAGSTEVNVGVNSVFLRVIILLWGESVCQTERARHHE